MPDIAMCILKLTLCGWASFYNLSKLYCEVIQPLGVSTPSSVLAWICFYIPSMIRLICMADPSSHVILYPWKPRDFSSVLGYFLRIVLTPEDKLLIYKTNNGPFSQSSLFWLSLTREFWEKHDLIEKRVLSWWLQSKWWSSKPLTTWPLVMAVQPDRPDVYKKINTSCYRAYCGHRWWPNKCKGLTVLANRPTNFQMLKRQPNNLFIKTTKFVMTEYQFGNCSVHFIA